MNARPADAVHADEARFHDDWAGSVDPGAISVERAFESPVAMENQFILRAMGDLRGKKLLDIGAGLGESSVYFAQRGADVTATDLSPGMVDFAVKLAERHGTHIRGVVSPAEKINLPDDSFDFIYIANTIHHVTDRTALFAEMRRVLRPGGKFFSIDPLAYNPLINIYRRMATEVRTADEKPLERADVRLAQRYFSNVAHCEFWLSTLTLFCKYFLIDRVQPNQARYWKRIFDQTPASLWWWRPLAALDRGLTRLPLIRWWSWNMVLWGTKPATP